MPDVDYQRGDQPNNNDAVLSLDLQVGKSEESTLPMNSDALTPKAEIPAMKHYASCHRCGNMRNKSTQCSNCPYVYCQRCTTKMIDEFGPTIFDNGCPVCKKLCCCSHKSLQCQRKYHCYKKCLSTKKHARSQSGRVHNNRRTTPTVFHNDCSLEFSENLPNISRIFSDSRSSDLRGQDTRKRKLKERVTKGHSRTSSAFRPIMPDSSLTRAVFDKEMSSSSQRRGVSDFTSASPLALSDSSGYIFDASYPFSRTYNGYGSIGGTSGTSSNWSLSNSSGVSNCNINAMNNASNSSSSSGILNNIMNFGLNMHPPNRTDDIKQFLLDGVKQSQYSPFSASTSDVNSPTSSAVSSPMSSMSYDPSMNSSPFSMNQLYNNDNNSMGNPLVTSINPSLSNLSNRSLYPSSSHNLQSLMFYSSNSQPAIGLSDVHAQSPFSSSPSTATTTTAAAAAAASLLHINSNQSPFSQPNNVLHHSQAYRYAPHSTSSAVSYGTHSRRHHSSLSMGDMSSASSDVTYDFSMDTYGTDYMPGYNAEYAREYTPDDEFTSDVTDLSPMSTPTCSPAPIFAPSALVPFTDYGYTLMSNPGTNTLFNSSDPMNSELSNDVSPFTPALSTLVPMQYSNNGRLNATQFVGTSSLLPSSSVSTTTMLTHQLNQSPQALSQPLYPFGVSSSSNMNNRDNGFIEETQKEMQLTDVFNPFSSNELFTSSLNQTSIVHSMNALNYYSHKSSSMNGNEKYDQCNDALSGCRNQSSDTVGVSGSTAANQSLCINPPVMGSNQMSDEKNNHKNTMNIALPDYEMSSLQDSSSLTVSSPPLQPSSLSMSSVPDHQNGAHFPVNSRSNVGIHSSTLPSSSSSLSTSTNGVFYSNFENQVPASNSQMHSPHVNALDASSMHSMSSSPLMSMNNGSCVPSPLSTPLMSAANDPRLHKQQQQQQPQQQQQQHQFTSKNGGNMGPSLSSSSSSSSSLAMSSSANNNNNNNINNNNVTNSHSFHSPSHQAMFSNNNISNAQSPSLSNSPVKWSLDESNHLVSPPPSSSTTTSSQQLPMGRSNNSNLNSGSSISSSTSRSIGNGSNSNPSHYSPSQVHSPLSSTHHPQTQSSYPSLLPFYPSNDVASIPCSPHDPASNPYILSVNENGSVLSNGCFGCQRPNNRMETLNDQGYDASFPPLSLSSNLSHARSVALGQSLDPSAMNHIGGGGGGSGVGVGAKVNSMNSTSSSNGSGLSAKRTKPMSRMNRSASNSSNGSASSTSIGRPFDGSSHVFDIEYGMMKNDGTQCVMDSHGIQQQQQQQQQPISSSSTPSPSLVNHFQSLRPPSSSIPSSSIPSSSIVSPQMQQRPSHDGMRIVPSLPNNNNNNNGIYNASINRFTMNSNGNNGYIPSTTMHYSPSRNNNDMNESVMFNSINKYDTFVHGNDMIPRIHNNSNVNNNNNNNMNPSMIHTANVVDGMTNNMSDNEMNEEEELSDSQYRMMYMSTSMLNNGNGHVPNAHASSSSARSSVLSSPSMSSANSFNPSDLIPGMLSSPVQEFFY